MTTWREGPDIDVADTLTAPCLIVVTKPLELTVAIAAFEVAQVTVFNVSLAGTEFVYSNTLLTTSGGVYVLAAPLAKDGRIDGVTSDFNLGVVQIALNGAIGQASPANGIFSFSLSPGTAATATGDLNGDGVLDVVVINYTTSQITTILSQTQ